MTLRGKNSGTQKEQTIAVHAGEFVDPVTRASSPNLVMSATFAPTDVTGFSARGREGLRGFCLRPRFQSNGSPTRAEIGNA